MSIAETICESIAHAAEDLHMGAIAVFTESGNTALLISKYRPKTAIFAFCNTLQVCNRMNLLWGVHPMVRAQALTTEEMLVTGGAGITASQTGKNGDVVGVVAGTQMSSGSTNFMRLQVVNGDAARAAKA